MTESFHISGYDINLEFSEDGSLNKFEVVLQRVANDDIPLNLEKYSSYKQFAGLVDTYNGESNDIKAMTARHNDVDTPVFFHKPTQQVFGIHFEEDSWNGPLVYPFVSSGKFVNAFVTDPEADIVW